MGNKQLVGDQNPLIAFGGLFTEYIQLEILVHLPLTDCLRLRTVCKLWNDLLKSQSLWKRKCEQYWPDYPLNDVDNYYRLFLQRGGAYFVTSYEHFCYFQKKAKKKGWMIEEIVHLTPTKELRSEVWRIRNEATGFQIIYNTINKRYYAIPNSMWKYAQTTSALDFNHPNLSPPIHVFHQKDFVCILMDPIVDTPCDIFLDTLLHDKLTGALTEHKVIKIMKQILVAVQFLHSKNLMVKSISGGRMWPICDMKDDWFQIKLFNYVFDYADLSTKIVPCIAPELQKAHSDSTIVLTGAADMWLVGNLAHMMLFGDYIFMQDQTRKLDRLFNNARELDPNDEVSAAAKDFLRKLLAVDPMQRMTAEAALNHEWMTNPQPATSELTNALRALEYRKQHPFTFQ